MISILRQALAAHPFEPITVVTADGATMVIKRAEFAAVLKRAGVLYVEPPQESKPRFVSLCLIKEVRAKNLAPTLADETAGGENQS